MSSRKDSDDEEEAKPVKTGDVSVMDLVPFISLCCCILSLYADIPDCLGTVCENTLLCCNCKIMTCKPSKEPHAFCKFCALDWDFIPASSCCGARSQIFCMDIRGACPPTGEFPCLLTLCCITCCYKYQCVCSCCGELRDVDEKAKGGKTGPYKFEEEWEAKVDPQTQLVYFENKTTGETQWQKPT